MIRSGANIARGRTVKINYNSACDLERVEKFKTAINNLAGMRKLAKMFQLIIRDMRSIIPCESVGIFVMTPHLLANR